MHATRCASLALLLLALSPPTAADEPPATPLTGMGGYGPAWSPDGDRIAFASDRSSGNVDLWVMPAIGEPETRLTTHPSEDSQPDWSPDGTYIVFMSRRQLGGAHNIFVIPAAGEPTVRGMNDPWNNDQPDWSPDSTQIAFQSDRNGNSDIWVMPSTFVGPATQLTTDPGLDYMPAWSPDGTQIAFTSDRSGNFDIWVMPAAGGAATQLTDDPGMDDFAAWSPDGTQIAFTSDRGGNYDIWVMLQTGEPATQITTDLWPDDRPAWSPDGTQIAFSSRRPYGGWYNIWVLTLPATSVEPDEAGAIRVQSLAIDPHPVGRHPTAVRFELAQAAPIRLILYGCDGRSVCILATGNHASGRHRIEWDARGVAPGVYFLRLETEGSAASRKVVVLDR